MLLICWYGESGKGNSSVRLSGQGQLMFTFSTGNRCKVEEPSQALKLEDIDKKDTKPRTSSPNILLKIFEDLVWPNPVSATKT